MKTEIEAERFSFFVDRNTKPDGSGKWENIRYQEMQEIGDITHDVEALTRRFLKQGNLNVLTSHKQLRLYMKAITKGKKHEFYLIGRLVFNKPFKIYRQLDGYYNYEPEKYKPIPVIGKALLQDDCTIKVV